MKGKTLLIASCLLAAFLGGFAAQCIVGPIAWAQEAAGGNTVVANKFILRGSNGETRAVLETQDFTAGDSSAGRTALRFYDADGRQRIILKIDSDAEALFFNGSDGSGRVLLAHGLYGPFLMFKDKSTDAPRAGQERVLLSALTGWANHPELEGARLSLMDADGNTVHAVP